jgi:hypothetical protein
MRARPNSIVIPDLSIGAKYGLEGRNKSRYFILLTVKRMDNSLLYEGDKDWIVDILYKPNETSPPFEITDADIYYDSQFNEYKLSYLPDYEFKNHPNFIRIPTSVIITKPITGGYRKIRSATKKNRRNRRRYSRNK